MQHRTVQRVSWGIAAGLAAAAWIFAFALRDLPGAAPDRPAAPEPSGAAAFTRHCAACHRPRELADPMTDHAAAAAMVAFLESHGHAPPADDLIIVAYLVELRDRGS